MGCNSAKLPVIEPEQIPSLRRLQNQSIQLKEIQKKIQKHLDSQSRSNASTPNDVIAYNKNSKNHSFRPEMTLSTIVQKTDISTIPLQRKSIY